MSKIEQLKTSGAYAPPLSNRGGRDSDGNCEAQEYERYEKYVIDYDGNIKAVPLRKGLGNSAFIDTLSFTFHESSVTGFFVDGKQLGISTPISDYDVIRNWSEISEFIFGFGVSSPVPVGKGRFYGQRWEMSVDGVLYGQVYIGGQNDTILIELSGKGCNVASDGWEQRLYKFLMFATNPRITRVDIAKDFFECEISPDSAWVSYNNGEFNKRGKKPLVSQIGSDWLNDTNTGKTLGIGSKQSSCYARIYDKAKEQGDVSGVNWCRFELQFMGRNCILPLDILLFPGQFWGGAFPICEKLQEKGSTERTVSALKRLEISIDRVKEVASNQAGRAINMMLQLGMSDSEIVECLKRKDGSLPERVNPASYALQDKRYLEFIHDEYRDSIELELIDDYGMVLEDREIYLNH